MPVLAYSLDAMLTLAQSQPVNSSGEAAGFAIFGIGFMCCFSVLGLAFFGFWLWMLIDCCTKTFPGENDKIMWVLVIVLTGIIGALVYFFVGRPKGVKT